MDRTTTRRDLLTAMAIAPLIAATPAAAVVQIDPHADALMALSTAQPVEYPPLWLRICHQFGADVRLEQEGSNRLSVGIMMDDRAPAVERAVEAFAADMDRRNLRPAVMDHLREKRRYMIVASQEGR